MDETARQPEVKAVEMFHYSDGHLTQFFIFNMPRLFREAMNMRHNICAVHSA